MTGPTSGDVARYEAAALRLILAQVEGEYASTEGEGSAASDAHGRVLVELGAEGLGAVEYVINVLVAIAAEEMLCQQSRKKVIRRLEKQIAARPDFAATDEEQP